MRRLFSSGRVAASFALALGALPCAGAAQAATPGWFVRLKLDNDAKGFRHLSSMLGQLSNAQPGFDANDLRSLPPFSAPFLFIAFPHPEWGGRAGDYTTDFRALAEAAPSWTFEIRANPIGDTVYLRWEGDPAALRGSTLTNLTTGQTIRVSDPRFITAGVPIVMRTATQRFVWRFQRPTP